MLNIFIDFIDGRIGHNVYSSEPKITSLLYIFSPFTFMKLFAIETGNFRLDGGAMFGVVPKVLWQKLYPADENNLCNWAMRSLLIDTGERKILIDNGIGNKQGHKFLRHYYLNGDATLQTSLAKHGYSFDDISDVILTHLHFDHCGGTIRYDENQQLVPTFPNAKIWVSRAQWDLATDPNHREKASFLKENILPMQASGKLNLIEEEGELYPNIEIKIFDGHTSGQIIPYITAGDKKLAFMADLLPSTAHIPMPYIMGYDTQPLLTLKDKERFYNDAIQNNMTLFFQHDLYNECCTLQKTPKGVRLDKTFKLNSL